MGVVQLLVGTAVILQSGPRIDKFTDAIAEDPAGYVGEEMTRMDGVNSTFSLLFVTELVLITGGITATLLARRKGKNTMAGISAGLATQAALILGQDLLASHRAKQYTMALEGFQMTVAPARRSFRFSYGGTF